MIAAKCLGTLQRLRLVDHSSLMAAKLLCIYSGSACIPSLHPDQLDQKSLTEEAGLFFLLCSTTISTFSLVFLRSFLKQTELKSCPKGWEPKQLSEWYSCLFPQYSWSNKTWWSPSISILIIESKYCHILTDVMNCTQI